MSKNGRMKLRQIKKVLQSCYKAHLSIRQISKSLHKPKSTVSDYVARFSKSGLSIEELDTKSDNEIYSALFPAESKRPKQRLQKILPDLNKIHLELKKKYVTRELLWEEYKALYPHNHYGYTHFCNLYKAWEKRLNVSMRIDHKAGEKMFLDFSGLKWEIIDRNSGELKEVEIFVSALGASGYSYAEATLNQTSAVFIASSIHAFEFFAGVTEILVPDNLKAAVTKADKYDPQINDTFQDMADHYGCVVIPARPYKSKDKAKVELSVKLVQRWILARLRHQQFFSLAELNQAIFALLDYFNNRIIKRYGKSRKELYLQLDKPALKALPGRPYILREFKDCKVNIDYHIEVDGSFYSVPYQLAGEYVSAIYTTSNVEVFYNNKRVALHVRSYQKGAFCTKEEHMASAHRVYGKWTPSRLITWGGVFGIYTKELMSAILASKPHPEMGFRICIAILNTAKCHKDAHAIEMTSKKMLELKCYKVKHFKDILQNKTYESQEKSNALYPPQHSNLRGNNYYR